MPLCIGLASLSKCFWASGDAPAVALGPGMERSNRVWERSGRLLEGLGMERSGKCPGEVREGPGRGLGRVQKKVQKGVRGESRRGSRKESRRESRRRSRRVSTEGSKRESRKGPEGTPGGPGEVPGGPGEARARILLKTLYFL